MHGPPVEASILQIIKETSLIFVLPSNPFFSPDSKLAVQEAAYAYSFVFRFSTFRSEKLMSPNRGNIFAQHFLNRLGPAYAALRDILDEQDTAQAAVLSDIRARFRQETFTRASILETLQRYPEIVRTSLLALHIGADDACADSTSLHQFRDEALLFRLHSESAHVRSSFF